MNMPAGSKTKKNTAPAGTGKKKTLTISVTIFKGNGDLDVDATLPKLQSFVEQHCDAAFFGTERGSNCAFLHLQVSPSLVQ